MRRTALFLSLFLCMSSWAHAQDMRAASQQAERDQQAAEEAAREAEARILEDRKALVAEVKRLENRERELEASLSRLQDRFGELGRTEDDLSKVWSERELAFRELVGTVRTSARDLETILKHSPFTAESPRTAGADQAPPGEEALPGSRRHSLDE